MSGHDRGAGSGRGRLRGGAGREDRRARRLGRASCGSACRSARPTPSRRTPASPTWSRRSPRIRSIKRASATPRSPRPPARRAASRSRSRQESGAASTEERRRHRPGDRLHAPTTSPSCPNSAAASPTSSTRPGSKRWRKRRQRRRRSSAPTARKCKAWCSCSAPASATRPAQHLPYCSGHCCATSIKQAMYFKDANPDVDTVVHVHTTCACRAWARTSTAARRRRA